MWFQYPQSIPGLQVGNFLRKSVSSVRGEEAARGSEFREKLTSAMEELDIPKSFLSRYVNDGFSGGEKKRFEILQLMLLQPRLAVLDETDSGLDIDGIRTVSKGINSVVRGTENGALIITHYSRILEHVNPDANTSCDFGLFMAHHKAMSLKQITLHRLILKESMNPRADNHRKQMVYRGNKH